MREKEKHSFHWDDGKECRYIIIEYGCLILYLYPLNVVSDDIRDKLIAKGIPASEIAYIHDAKTEQQKSDLFDKVRSGEIRVLLGSAIVSSNEQHTD